MTNNKQHCKQYLSTVKEKHAGIIAVYSVISRTSFLEIKVHRDMVERASDRDVFPM